MIQFRIAATFTDSLARLTGDEQKAVKTTAFDLQLNPASPGLSFHKLDKVRDKNFWSVRVSRDIRLIVHRSEASLLLCYVDHHDKAYDWAERRKLETHPRTGAAQLVEIRETVREIFISAYVQAESGVPTNKKGILLFSDKSDDELLGYGVPPEWLADVKRSDEDMLLALYPHLPGEAAEALLELATGGRPRASKSGEVSDVTDRALASIEDALASGPHASLPPVAAQEPVDFPTVSPATKNPFEHPDAQRRFRIIHNVEELERALEFPWDKWSVFLHPDQRELVERNYNGPVRVSGSAGTGKTIVAIHRAAFLARKNSDARVLLTTFSEALAQSLRTKMRRLLGNEPRLAERIDVHSLEAIARRLYTSHIGAITLAAPEIIEKILEQSAGRAAGKPFGMRFLRTEWNQIVDAWQLKGWDAYRDVARLGRKTRLPESRRRELWSIFEVILAELKSHKLSTPAAMFTEVADAISKSGRTPFDYIVIDEAQDISPAHLRFLAALGGNRRDALFFAGDLGQRIFQQPFSWKSLGVDIQGRSRTLRVNYRTSHQIRRQADLLLGAELTDVDGNAESRDETVSVFNGPVPLIQVHDSADAEYKTTGAWIEHLTKDGLAPHEFGVFVRSRNQLDRACEAVKASGLEFAILDDQADAASGRVAVGTMHMAKGLEFRAVVVMACDDEIIPLQARIEAVGDDADLQEVYDTERHLLYVAATRARDHLLVSGVNPASEFLDDLQGSR